MKLSAIAFFLLLLPALGQSVDRYVNARYGYGIDIPKGFSAEPEAANGDGRKYTAADGQVTLLVYGGNNIDDSSTKSLRKQALQELPAKPAYKPQGKNWFVLSWLDGDTIHYRKTFVGSGSINTFWLSYPKSLSKRFDPVATKLEGSFRPGNLKVAH